MNNETIKTISLRKINAVHFPFSCSFPRECDMLVASIKKFGLLTPVIVREHCDGGRYEVICGARRVMALKKLKEKQVLACVYRHDMLSDKEAFLMNLSDNITVRRPNDIERSLVVRGLKEKAGYPDKEIIELFADTLEIPQSYKWLEQFRRFSELDAAMKRSLAEEQLHREVACKLLAFESADRPVLFRMLDALGCGRNKAHQLLELLFEITQREHVALKNVMRSKKIRAIIHNEKLGKPEKFQRVRDILCQRRYPRYILFKQQFEKKVKALELPRHVYCHSSDHFETRRVRFMVDCNDAGDLKRAAEHLQKIAEGKKGKDLFETL